MQDYLTTKNAVAAIRASTIKQGTDGDSPEAQKKQIKKFALSNGIRIQKFFVFLESASKEQQPIQEAIDYCKNPKNNINVFLIKSIDRFTRGGGSPYDQLKLQLEKCDIQLVDVYGIISQNKVNTLEHLGVEYSWSKYSPSQKAEYLEAERAKDELRDIESRMIGAQIRYARMGYWVRSSIYGFVNEKIDTPNGKRCIMKPHPDEFSFVEKMFELRCQGTLEDREIVEEINRLGYKTRVNMIRDKEDRAKAIQQKGGKPLTLKVLWRLIQNPVYAGVNPEKWTQGKPVKCKFDGLVSIETFNKANRGKVVISEKNGEVTIATRKPPEYLIKKGARNPDFPYKRYVMCPHCVKPLYGSASRGRLGKYYPAYHCNNRGHHFRIPKKEFDEVITQFVSAVSVTPERIEEFNKVILAEWEKRQQTLHKDEESIDTRITALQIQARMTVDKIKFLSSPTAIKYMEEDLVKIEEQITTLEQEKENKVPDNQLNIQTVMKYVTYFLEHLEYLLLQQVDTIKRANYFSVLFDKLPTYQEIILGTQDLGQITGMNEVFTILNSPKGHMAGAAGFEPANAGTKNQCLTTWPRPNIYSVEYFKIVNVLAFGTGTIYIFCCDFAQRQCHTTWPRTIIFTVCA